MSSGETSFPLNTLTFIVFHMYPKIHKNVLISDFKYATYFSSKKENPCFDKQMYSGSNPDGMKSDKNKTCTAGVIQRGDDLWSFGVRASSTQMFKS